MASAQLRSEVVVTWIAGRPYVVHACTACQTSTPAGAELSHLLEDREKLCHSNGSEPLGCGPIIQQRHSLGQMVPAPGRGTGSGRPVISVWRRLLVGCGFHSSVGTPPSEPQTVLAGLWMQRSRLSWRGDLRGVTIGCHFWTSTRHQLWIE